MVFFGPAQHERTDGLTQLLADGKAHFVLRLSILTLLDRRDIGTPKLLERSQQTGFDGIIK